MRLARLRRTFLMWTLVLPLALTGQVAGAQSLQDNIIAQLQAQGFVEFQTSRTLLGRLQIIAIGPEFRREIVLNPHTGEILRDYLSTNNGQAQNPQLVSPERRERADDNNRAPRDPRDEDDDRDDDDDDDRDDDDNDDDDDDDD